MTAHLWSLLIRNQCPREDERRDEGDRGESTFPLCPKGIVEWWPRAGFLLSPCLACCGASSLRLLAEKPAQSYAAGSKAAIRSQPCLVHMPFPQHPAGDAAGCDG